MYTYYVLRGTQSDKTIEREGEIDEEQFSGVDLGDGRAILNHLMQSIERDTGDASMWEEAELTDSFFNRDDSYIRFNGRWIRRSDAPWRKDRNN